ncbi:MAG: metallopeptidase TldD-related protein, partial [Bryobacteraceae bacterium]
MRTRLPLFLLSAALLAQAPGDAVLRALRDEVARSRTLKVENLEPPYFIEGSVDDIDSFSATGMLGGLVRSSRSRLRVPRVQVRVGDYKFDNTNYAGFFSRSQFDRLPLDDAYPVLRRYLWLGTDRAYKTALETISRKRAALRNVSAGELPEDFAKATPLKRIEPVSFVPVDEPAWTRRVRAVSGVFNRFPAIRSSLTEMEAVQNIHYLVNSEGSEIRFGERILFVRSRASSQAADGMILRDSVSFHTKDFSRFASDADLTAATTAMAGNLTALAAAPKGEPYNGPVVFEREAAAQVLAAVLGKSLSLARRPVTDPGRSGNFPPSDLEGRTGSRILPEFLDVVDDPTQTEWRGRPLLGSYSVDLEGVTAQPLTLVEKGVLKNFLLTRQPMRSVTGSNGRARMPGSFGANAASFSNLFIQSRDPVSLA